MSTRDGYRVHRAIVRSVDLASGVCMVQVPASAGAVVPVSPLGLPTDDGAYVLPAPGDHRMVVSDPDKSDFYWVIGPDSSSIWAAIAELRAVGGGGSGLDDVWDAIDIIQDAISWFE